MARENNGIKSFISRHAHKNGGADWVRTKGLGLMKPVDSSAATPNQAIIDELVAYKKSTKRLIPRGEGWLMDMTGRILKQLGISVTDVGPQQIVGFCTLEREPVFYGKTGGAPRRPHSSCEGF